MLARILTNLRGSKQRTDVTEYAGYLAVYHLDETHAVHAILSQGATAHKWTQVQRNQPLLVPTAGERGVRDPHLLRSQVDGRFHLLGTDLDIRQHPRTGPDGESWEVWHYVVRHGSRHIHHWVSDDLINWAELPQIELAPANAGMAWAPKAVWDEKEQAYLVVFSAMVYPTGPERTGEGAHRLLARHTRDFVEFGPVIDWGHPTRSTIDAAIVQDGDGYVRFIKDEDIRDVFAEASADLSPEGWAEVSPSIKGDAETGMIEGPVVFQDFNTGKWFLWVDEYTEANRGYLPFTASDLRAPVWELDEEVYFPNKIKHGSVLPLTAEEFDRLIELT